MHKSLIYLFFIFIYINAYSQDIHFSQFFNSPVNINPSIVGDFVGQGRVIFNYRDQWSQTTTNPYRTFAIYADKAFYKEKFFAGVQIFQDRAGDANMGLTQINLNIASKVQINKYDYLKLGLQGALSQHSYNFNKLTWGNQFDGFSINPDIFPNEQVYSQSISYVDISAGLLWLHKRKNGMNYKLGFSAYHITRPVYNFWGNMDRLSIRWCTNGEMSIPLNKRTLEIYPSFLAMLQGPGREVIFGSGIRYTMGLNSKYTGYNMESHIFLGFYYRYSDALIVLTQFNYRNQLNVGLSYDITVSELQMARNFQGGLELSIIYIIPPKVSIKLKNK